MSNIKRYGYIVNKQFTVSKKRNLSTILGIILSIVLFTTVGYIIKFYREINILDVKERNGIYEAVISNVSNEEINLLRNNIFIDKLGLYSEIYNTEVNTNYSKKHVNLYALEQLFYKKIDLLAGRFPRENKEIIIDTVGSEILSKNIGDTLELRDRVYKIVGVYNKKDTISTYNIDIITNFNTESNLKNINAAFTVKSNKNKDKVIRKIVEDIGINLNNEYGKNRLNFNEMLFYYYGGKTTLNNYKNMGVRYEIIPLYGAILVLSILLIYGSINISIKERIQQFQVLRCIGATPAKIRMLLIRESLFLTGLSVLPGVILGQLICYFISPYIIGKFSDISSCTLGYRFYSDVIIVVIILTVVSIVMATIIPIIKIGHISPIQNILNEGMVEKSVKKRNSKIIRKLFGYSGELAYKNIRANNKNFIITTVTSIVLLTTFIAFTGYNNNLKETFKVKKENDKDVTLEIWNTDLIGNKNIFNIIKKYEDEIKELDVSKEVFTRVNYSLTGIFKGVKLNKNIRELDKNRSIGEKNISFGNENQVYSNSINLLIMKEETLKSLMPFLEGDLSLDDFKDNGVIVVDRGVVKNFFDVVREPLFDLEIGERFTLEVKDRTSLEEKKSLEDEIKEIKNSNNKIDFKYLGSININDIFDSSRYGYDNYTTLIVSEDFYNNNSELFINESDAIEKDISLRDICFLIELRDDINRDLALKTIENYSKLIEGIYLDNELSTTKTQNDIFAISRIVYIILTLTMIIGGVNIINNKIININLRGKEIGTLLALGIRKKRLKKILMLEGIVQWFISTSISLILSYVILKITYKVLIYSSVIVTEKIPILAIILGSLSLLLINILGVYLPIRKLEYEKTTDLIRNKE